VTPLSDGELALVTSAGRGIERAIALELAAAGARALHERFARSYEEGSLITAGQSARSLMDHLASDATGEIWNVNSNRPVK
jgi:NAD(P)-dependent dehydrogenase (short-subunit alcohol dehydrogenase family)